MITRYLFMISSETFSKSSSSKKGIFLFWLGCFVFYFFIMFCAPYTYDDYEFARVEYGSFQELLKFCLTYGNGRLLGNMGAIVLNQNPVLGALAKGFVMSTTVILIPALLHLGGWHSYFLSFLLITAIDPALFAQVFTWTSGFQNYVPPVFLMLTILYLMQTYPNENGVTFKKVFYCIALFIIAFASQLYIEHSSIINLVLSAFLVVKACKEKRCLAPAVTLLVATIAGLIFMFWIPSYFMASSNNHTTGYRSFYINSLFTLIFNCARNAIRLTNHYLGMSGIPLCAGSAITVWLTRCHRKEKWNSILYAGSVIPLIYMIVCTLLNTEGWYAEPAILHHIIAMIAVLSALFTWIIALFRMQDTVLRNRIWVLLGFAVFSLMPLLIVTPIRIRVLYHSQIFVIMAFILCFSDYMKFWNSGFVNSFTKYLFISTVITAVTLGSVFISIRNMTVARHEYTVSQMAEGAKEIEFFRVPYEYVHDATDSGIGDYYFYDYPRDIQFNIIPFDQWMDNYLE